MLYALTSESNAVLHNLENTCGSKHCRCDYELNLLQIRCGPSITNNNSSEFVIFRNTILDLVIIYPKYIYISCFILQITLNFLN